MRLAERYSGILGWFRDNMSVAQSELNFSNPYELTVAVMLSAQCTDKRVNLTTPELFRRYPTVGHLAEASFEDVLDIIRSISYPNSKALHLIGMAQKVLSDFNGEIPPTVEELMTLPGVGRKTANVVSSIVWNEPVVAVDTHVFRVSHRLGLSRGKTPRAVELDLERHIPEEIRPTAHHWLILHGRYVCTAKKPQCGNCGLKKWCADYISRTASSVPQS
ncbi:MAG: endonuclease III [Bacteroidales bacterium]|nr:endonuclease III [Bacteroidales bacterium]